MIICDQCKNTEEKAERLHVEWRCGWHLLDHYRWNLHLCEQCAGNVITAMLGALGTPSIPCPE